MVTLGADIAAALPELRRQAESLHLDTFTVFRRTGGVVTDPVTHEETPEFATVLSGVMGKLQTTEAQSRDTQTPGQKVTETGLSWHTSVNTLGVLTDDEVVCTASVHDPALVGLRVRVVGPFLKSIATARRFQVSELS